VKKIIKAVLLIILYLGLYSLIMGVSVLVLGLTVGGAGAELSAMLRSGADMPGEAAVQAAVNAATERIIAFFGDNTALILAISALVSLMFFSLIFAARKKNLFAELAMNRAPAGIDILYGAFAGGSSNFVIVLLIGLLQLTRIFSEQFEQYDTYISFTLGSGSLFRSFLCLGLVVPLVEEILFRGLVTYEFRKIMPVRAAIVAQGVLFGLYHLEPVQIGYTIPLGIFFGYCAYKSGSVWTAVAAHAAMNSVTLLLMIPGLSDTLQTQPEFFLLYAGGAIVLFLSALVYFVRKKPPQQEPPNQEPPQQEPPQQEPPREM
jgi:membrane protease YdiL (CAAX protease family)